MDVICEKRDGSSVLKVSGRMDVVFGPTFEKECQELIEAEEKKLIIDMSGLEYISSAGLRSILSSAKKMKAAGGSMQFCGLQGVVKEVFEISGFCSMFTVTESVEQAFD